MHSHFIHYFSHSNQPHNLIKNLKEMRNRWQVKVAIGGFATSTVARVKNEWRSRSSRKATHDSTTSRAANTATMRSGSSLNHIEPRLWLSNATNSSRMEHLATFFRRVVSAWKLWFTVESSKKWKKNMSFMFKVLIETFLSRAWSIAQASQSLGRNLRWPRAALVMTNDALLSQQPPVARDHVCSALALALHHVRP